MFGFLIGHVNYIEVEILLLYIKLEIYLDDS